MKPKDKKKKPLVKENGMPLMKKGPASPQEDLPVQPDHDGQHDDEHDDEAQDKQLIMDMIKKHMGDDGKDMGDDGNEAAHQAYQGYQEMGYGHDEAMKCAAHAMKLAKHMAAKQAKMEAEGENEGKQTEKHQSENENETHQGEMEAEKDDDKEETHHEAETKLVARVAFLERELKKRELNDYMDRRLASCGFGRLETDKIRALIGSPKSETDIDKTIKIFNEAYAANNRGKSIFVTSMEKQTSAGVGRQFNFGAFVKK